VQQKTRFPIFTKTFFFKSSANFSATRRTNEQWKFLLDKEEILQQICFYLLLSVISSLKRSLKEFRKFTVLIAVKNVAREKIIE